MSFTDEETPRRRPGRPRGSRRAGNMPDLDLTDGDDDDISTDDDAVDIRHVEGCEDAEAELSPWLEKVLKDADNEDVLNVTLYHHSRSGENSVWTGKLAFGDGVQDFVSELMKEAAGDCLRNRGRNKYAVRVRGKKGCKRFDLVTPELREDEDPEKMIDFDEAPDNKGLLAQLMRHSEKQLKLALTSSREMSEVVMRTNRDLNREIGEFRENYREQRAYEEKLRRMDFAREMEIKKFERTEKRREEMVSTVMTVGKAVLSQKLGLPLLADSTVREAVSLPKGEDSKGVPVEARVIRFLQMLKPAQFEALNLSEAQKSEFMSLYASLTEWHEKNGKATDGAVTPETQEKKGD